MKRKHHPTSKEGEEHIKPFKPSHRSKISSGLDKLRVGGTFEEIAIASSLRDDQVWKRLSEMEKDSEIFNTGITRKLRSGVHGIVWQKAGMAITDEAPTLDTKNGHSIKSTKKKVIIPSNQQPLNL